MQKVKHSRAASHARPCLKIDSEARPCLISSTPVLTKLWKAQMRVCTASMHGHAHLNCTAVLNIKHGRAYYTTHEKMNSLNCTAVLYVKHGRA